MEVILVLGLALLAIGCWLWARGRAGELRLGVPVRNIDAADVGVDVPTKAALIPKRKKLFSKQYRVVGIADYLTDDQEVYMPIEIKSASVREPRISDVFQLLTQCFLLEEEGHAVNCGRLVYANMKLDIPYGPRERQEVLQVLDEMRQAEKMRWQDIPRKQDHRCGGCGYKTICKTPDPCQRILPLRNAPSPIEKGRI